MKVRCAIVSMIMVFLLGIRTQAMAQDPITEVIKEGIKKAIKAIDLEIQRLQNKTIWLQNAQKAVENTFSKLRLDEIGSWVEKQKQLYQQYFDELSQVKTLLSYYFRVKGIIDQQTRIVEEYKAAFALFKNDARFTPQEIQYMQKVYTGIIDESLKNLDQVFLVVNSFRTQMTDAKRLAYINEASDRLSENESDLRRFNEQNKMLSLSRAKDQTEIEEVKKLYGLK